MSVAADHAAQDAASAKYLLEHPEELAKWIPRGVSIPPSPWIPHTPWPKQWLFLLCNELEAFFGGAAGPGKTDVLLAGAAQYVDHPHYNAVLVRRTWVDLNQSGGLIPRSKEWWGGTKAEWNETRRCWRFPGRPGATVQFMHMELPDDRYKWKGLQCHFIGIDELTEFEMAEMYTYGFRSLRKVEGDPIPLRMRSGSNPGGPGHEWVKKRFIEKMPRGKQFAILDMPNAYDSRKPSYQCVVLLGTLDDNPSLDRGYENSLDMLSPLERRRQRFGDWDAAQAGSFFDRMNFSIVKKMPCDWVARVRAWDRAGSETADADYTVGVRACLGSDENIYFDDMIRGQWTSGKVDEIQRAVAETDGVETIIAIQQDPAAAGKAEAERVHDKVLSSFNCEVETVATNVKGAKALRARPLASGSERKRVFLIEGRWNDDFLSELQEFREDGKHNHDDIVDSASLAYRKLETPGGCTITQEVDFEQKDSNEYVLQDFD